MPISANNFAFSDLYFNLGPRAISIPPSNRVLFQAVWQMIKLHYVGGVLHAAICTRHGLSRFGQPSLFFMLLPFTRIISAHARSQ